MKGRKELRLGPGSLTSCTAGMRLRLLAGDPESQCIEAMESTKLALSAN